MHRNESTRRFFRVVEKVFSGRPFGCLNLARSHLTSDPRCSPSGPERAASKLSPSRVAAVLRRATPINSTHMVNFTLPCRMALAFDVVAYSACAARAVLVRVLSRRAQSAPGAPRRQRPARIARSSLASLGPGVKIGIAFGAAIDIDFHFNVKL